MAKEYKNSTLDVTGNRQMESLKNYHITGIRMRKKSCLMNLNRQ